LLGPERPNDIPGHYSGWQPFEGAHGASGHAFVGAVPLITAANMTDNWLLKGGLYFASTVVGWSRINDDRHYLSQVCLGWYLGYLAARAVNDTQTEDTRYSVMPMLDGDGVGVLFVKQY
jgi:membrane-associated phospholipid phosphatase